MDIDINDLPVAKLIRLKNGDDIIAEVVEIGEGDKISSLVLINPLKALYVPSTATGYLQIAFMPWVYPRICSDQEFTISASEVLLCCNVSEKMNEYYWDSIDTYIAEQKDKKDKKIEEEPEPDYIEEIAELMQSIKDKRTMH
jgi:hypothetical protein